MNERTGEGVAHGLQASRATAMVGVPALWQLLERRILQQVDARGPLARAAFDAATEVNRWLAANVGVDAGRLLFGAVHARMGGNIKWLISGGAALPRETQERFFGLGLRLTQGYGLTEAAPVLTVTRPNGRIEPGVGKALPGVELRIANADDRGVGEVVARGANVMVGYTDEARTGEAIDAEGWLHTGDVGRIDKKGRLEILGRLKDVVISPNGENVYPDDVERRLGEIPDVGELAIVGVEVRGGERLACLAVPASASASGAHENGASTTNGAGRANRNARARAALRAAIDSLPPGQRPAIVHLYEAPLPRTATRKVKRDEVRAILTRLTAAQQARHENGAEDASPVRAAIASLCGISLEQIGPHSTLRGDLGFDSLLLTELLEILETRFGAIDPNRLQACLAVADVEEIVQNHRRRRVHRCGPRSTPPRRGANPRAAIVLPEPVQEVGRALIGKVQDLFYGEVMKPRVFGRAHIPHNRNVIVVANHASHLDMGLVRHALGTYGEDIVSLAAHDYFFEGRVKRAFFENLTNLRPIDRKASLRQSIRQATDLLERGKTLLVFPEGTRSSEIQEFKPLVGTLALASGVDLLPICLVGYPRRDAEGSPLPGEARRRRANRTTALRRGLASPDRWHERRGRGERGGAYRASCGPRAPRRAGARPRPGARRGPRGGAGEPAHRALRGARDEVSRRGGGATPQLLCFPRQRRAREVDRPRGRAPVRRSGGQAAGRRGRLRPQDEPGDLRQDRARVLCAEPGRLRVGRVQVERRDLAHDVSARVSAGSALVRP